MNSLHYDRYKLALNMNVKFILLDIDHNITNSNGIIPVEIYDTLAHLLNYKKIGIGFVSGRPKSLTVPNSNDIDTVVNILIEKTLPQFKQNIIIFPEHCGYGFIPATCQEYDYGFIAEFENSKHKIADLINSKKLSWLDFVEFKCTSFALWIKPACLDPEKMTQYLKEVDEIITISGLSASFKSVNGANRTVDILQRGVDKCRSIIETAKLFNISSEQIATFDDQAGHKDTGYLFTEHILGFATQSYHTDSIKQISTRLTINLTGVEAVGTILTQLKFSPL